MTASILKSVYDFLTLLSMNHDWLECVCVCACVRVCACWGGLGNITVHKATQISPDSDAMQRGETSAKDELRIAEELVRRDLEIERCWSFPDACCKHIQMHSSDGPNPKLRPAPECATPMLTR